MYKDISQEITVFDLIRNFSPYAILFYFSLLLPFLWFFYKKSLSTRLELKAERKKHDKKIITEITKKTKKITANENRIFYLSVIVFLLGSIVLKIGQFKEEKEIHKKAKIMANYFCSKKIQKCCIGDLCSIPPINSNDTIDRNSINRVLEKYPFTFFKIDHNDTIIAVKDKSQIKLWDLREEKK